MRNLLLTLLPSLLSAAAAHGGTCNLNQPLQWIVNPIYVDGATTNAIQGDGVYIDGQSGVETHINVCSGTGDATILLSGRRSLFFSFARILATNTNTPSWARSGSTESVGFMNVRNLAFVPANTDRSQEYTFTTRLGSTFSAGNLAMLNPNPSATYNVQDGNVAIANSPNNDALVIVHHCPSQPAATSTCPNTIHETWFVYPDPAGTPAQVATLLVTVKGKPANGGEFSMPFYFAISTLQ